jgi:hypothetical protein
VVRFVQRKEGSDFGNISLFCRSLLLKGGLDEAHLLISRLVCRAFLKGRDMRESKISQVAGRLVFQTAQMRLLVGKRLCGLIW